MPGPVSQARSWSRIRRYAGPHRRGRSVIARAGATTCAELIAAGRASILVPFAGAAEGHQAGNAAALAGAGGAEVLAEADLTPGRLKEKIRAFLDEPARLERMAAALQPLKTPSAAAASPPCACP